jgi:hypothetical protein
MTAESKQYFCDVSEDKSTPKMQIFLNSKETNSQATVVKQITKPIMLNSTREMLFE